jgi:hypothetical protein
MANPTTNYGFVLPTATDLVTDLPADFDVALQGVDTRLKALQPGTTLGDLAYSSATANTNTRLGVGSTGQVLTVAGGVPSWATPAGAGSNWSLLNSGGTALTGATTITVSGISGKDKIMVLIDKASASASSRMRIRMNTDTTNVYYVYGISLAAGVLDSFGGASSGIDIGSMQSNTAGTVSAGATFTGCNSSGVKQHISYGSGSNEGFGTAQEAKWTQGYVNLSATISSISVFSDTGNFDAGTVYVYTSA